MKKSTLMTSTNDSDVGYFDDFFIEEVRKEIRATLDLFNVEKCEESIEKADDEVVA